jgi:hypothetical protein
MNSKTLKGNRAASRAALLDHQAQNGRARAESWGGKPSRKADRRASKKSLRAD